MSRLLVVTIMVGLGEFIIEKKSPIIEKDKIESRHRPRRFTRRQITELAINAKYSELLKQDIALRGFNKCVADGHACKKLLSDARRTVEKLDYQSQLKLAIQRWTEVHLQQNMASPYFNIADAESLFPDASEKMIFDCVEKARQNHKNIELATQLIKLEKFI